MKIALDAGHGACRGRPHTGAAANGLIEDELALDFVRRIGHHLRAAGHGTVCTRPAGTLVPLRARAAAARLARCETFLSIHCNAGPPSAQGVEAFVAGRDERSHTVAHRLVDAVCRHGMKSRGVKWDSQSQHPRLTVLRETYKHMPAVLLEIGFLTNLHDAALLADRFWREAVSVALARTVPDAGVTRTS